jgi:hypothetical protein
MERDGCATCRCTLDEGRRQKEGSIMKNLLRSVAVIAGCLLFGCAHSMTAPAPAPVSNSTSAPTATLDIDFGPLSGTDPSLTYQVPWHTDSQPVDYLQEATKLQPPLKYTCSSQDGRPCDKTLGDCSVTSINGVKNQFINNIDYAWMWYIDGNIGALSPCIFSLNSPKDRIKFQLTQVGPH